MIKLKFKENAKKFAERWKGRGRERSESQSFWLSLLGEVYGMTEASGVAELMKLYLNLQKPVANFSIKHYNLERR